MSCTYRERKTVSKKREPCDTPEIFFQDEHWTSSIIGQHIGLYQRYLVKSWAVVPLKFQSRKLNEDDFFGPAFNSTSPG